MKIKTLSRAKLYVAFLLITLTGVVSCEEEKPVVVGNEYANVTVAITGGVFTKAFGEVNPSAESAIKNLGIYIYNSGGMLQNFEYVTVSEGTSEFTVENVITGRKTIVVLTNFGVKSNYPASTIGGSTYNQLMDSDINFNSIPQTAEEVETSGLPMCGIENGFDLSTSDSSVDIAVKYLVAKVELTGLTLGTPNDGAVGAKISGVSIMKTTSTIILKNAIGGASVNPPVIQTSNLLHGLPTKYTDYISSNFSSDKHVNGTFTEELGAFFDTKVDSENQYDNTNPIYFYVLPNYGTNVTSDLKKATLLTLISDYSGETATVSSPYRFYPVILNNSQNGMSTGSNGKLIEPGNYYKLSVALKHHDSGLDTPEEIAEKTDMTVTISVEPWEVVSQILTWD